MHKKKRKKNPHTLTLQEQLHKPREKSWKDANTSNTNT